jgi:hypothetical protein
MLSKDELDKILLDLDDLWNSLTKEEQQAVSSLDNLDD